METAPVYDFGYEGCKSPEFLRPIEEEDFDLSPDLRGVTGTDVIDAAERITLDAAHDIGAFFVQMVTGGAAMVDGSETVDLTIVEEEEDVSEFASLLDEAPIELSKTEAVATRIGALSVADATRALDPSAYTAYNFTIAA